MALVGFVVSASPFKPHHIVKMKNCFAWACLFWDMHVNPLTSKERGNTAVDWQCGDRSTSWQNQWWSTLIPLIALWLQLKRPTTCEGCFSPWIPLLHVQSEASTLDAVACSSVLRHSNSLYALYRLYINPILHKFTERHSLRPGSSVATCRASM